MRYSLSLSASTIAIATALTGILPQVAYAGPALTCSAGVCTAQIDVAGSLVSMAGFNSPSSYTLNIPMFNSATGNLTQVIVSGHVEEYGTGTITNNSATAFDVYGQFTSRWSFGTTGVASLDAVLATITSASPAIFVQYTKDGLAGNGGKTAFSPSPGGSAAAPKKFYSGSGAGPTTITTNLADYVTSSSGVLSSAVTATGSIGSGVVGNAAGSSTNESINTFGDVIATITYDYTTQQQPVPEPGSLALLGGGLGGLGVLRRRRRRRTA